jgi:hypothetical protein
MFCIGTRKRWIVAGATALIVLSSFLVDAQATGSECTTKYPIVLSHHWGARKICDEQQAGVRKSCEKVEESKNCRQWVGDRCVHWAVPPDELYLPPRNYNHFNADLVREMSEYHRYFSKEIVGRLTMSHEEGGCANKVYIADKPAFASYEERAKVLRQTVLLALRENGAAKVNIIGMSQGAQDARYMAAVLPINDDEPNLGLMSNVVASIVSLAGEHAGAESADLSLAFFNLLNQGRWEKSSALGSFWNESDFNKLLWQDKTSAVPMFILSEVGYNAIMPGLRSEDKFKAFLRSTAELSTRFMSPDRIVKPLSNRSWSSLRRYAGMPDDNWLIKVPPRVEEDNGVSYYSFGAQIRVPASAWGADSYIHGVIKLLYGDNDGYVTVKSQTFNQRFGANFQHVKILRGMASGSGYHHMFFSGRNDGLYAPANGKRESGLYGGSSADFYEAVARKLVSEGF